MTIVLRCADPNHPAFFNQFVKTYNAEAFGGRGDVTFTSKKEEAVTFPDLENAIGFYRTVPKCRPVRDDGNPNRPLTAFSILFENVENNIGL